MAPDSNIIMRRCHFHWHSTRDVAFKMQIVSTSHFIGKISLKWHTSKYSSD